MRGLRAKMGVLLATTLVSSCTGGKSETLEKREPRQPSEEAAERTEPDRKSAAKPRLARVDCAEFEQFAEVLDKSSTDPNIKCATVTVPIDYSDPEKGTIDLAVGRIPSSGQASRRLGVLFLNPGGPGGSGLEYLASQSSLLPGEIRRRFDLVSFDPRGVGDSAPFDCWTQQQRQEYIESEPSEDPAEAAQQALDVESNLAQACTKREADLFPEMGTDAVADDLEQLRVAFGDEPLNYFGMSYGTRIGAAYASKYPDQVRAIALDGSVTPTGDLAAESVGQARSILRSAKGFFERCDSVPACPLGPNSLARLLEIEDRLQEGATVPGSDADIEPLDEVSFALGFVTALYDPSIWEAAAAGMDALFGEDEGRRTLGADLFLNLAGSQTGIGEDGTYDNDVELRWVVNCHDSVGPLTPEAATKLQREIDQVVAESGLQTLFEEEVSEPPGETACTKLPSGSHVPAQALKDPKRVLVIGNAGDPVTPIEFAREMSSALGGAPLISYAGFGHLAGDRVPCVSAQLERFFVVGKAGPWVRDCEQDVNEFDVFYAFERLIDSFEIAPGYGACIANGLAAEFEPLEVVAVDSEDSDNQVTQQTEAIAEDCVEEILERRSK